MTEHIYPDVFTTSESTTNIVAALLKFNSQIGVIDKSAKNPFFRSDYADLPTILKDIKDPLNNAELTINHFPVGDNRLITRLSHSSGEFFQGVFFMQSVKDTPQDRGMVITYMMRYSVGAYLGLAIDKDDDGNTGAGRKVAAPPTVPKLKTMTAAIESAMLKYITDGNLEAVEKKLPMYNENAKKTVVKKALSDAKAIDDLADTNDDKNDK